MELTKPETAAAKKKRLAAEALVTTELAEKAPADEGGPAGEVGSIGVRGMAADEAVEDAEYPEGVDNSVGDWKTRVKVERAELYARIQALTEFVETEGFAALDDVDQAHLETQLEAMNLYRRALDTRIAKF